MVVNVGDVVLPGECLPEPRSNKGVVILGPGLRRSEDDSKGLTVSRAGVLCHKAPNMYWVEGHAKRYVPCKGDLVVGVVAKKSGDQFKIDIGSAEHASLSAFSFEGATKKQKPDLQVGDVVYAKLVTAHREMEPELVCVNKYFKAANLGPLSNQGFLLNLDSRLIVRLLDVQHPLLAVLAKTCAYEIAIGMNGKVFVMGRTSKDTMHVAEALLAAQHHDNVTT
ncbi:PREDICTED: exosome complex component RRP40 [Nicrophorus vespilloides]|uniref:Ribosomal RNA-processing protein 40 n=1 Tax=Nicrophorus vespilloides TaxID=110193 RepID=A0ABM1MFP8_NICVS|nr:PREDICTED: exosome complex component RRP40 [Nicrophorus vespilloides]